MFLEPIHNMNLLFTNKDWGPYLLKNFLEPLTLLIFHLGFMQSQGYDQSNDFRFFEDVFHKLREYINDDVMLSPLIKKYEEAKKNFN